MKRMECTIPHWCALPCLCFALPAVIRQRIEIEQGTTDSIQTLFSVRIGYINKTNRKFVSPAPDTRRTNERFARTRGRKQCTDRSLLLFAFMLGPCLGMAPSAGINYSFVTGAHCNENGSDKIATP